MGNPFDDLTKKLAKKALTRRESLRWIGGGFIGAALATLGFGKLIAGASGHPTCPDYCRSLGLTPGKGNDFGKCVENCAHCREAGGTACGAGSCCFDDAVCCPEGTVGATCVTCGDGEEFDPATCTCVSTCCESGSTCNGAVYICGGIGACACATTTEDTLECIANGSCSGAQTCSASTECPSGFVCIVNTCCASGVCAQLCDCGDGGGAKRAIIPDPDMPSMFNPGQVNLK
jgi:hypothetical protein